MKYVHIPRTDNRSIPTLPSMYNPPPWLNIARCFLGLCPISVVKRGTSYKKGDNAGIGRNRVSLLHSLSIQELFKEYKRCLKYVLSILFKFKSYFEFKLVISLNKTGKPISRCRDRQVSIPTLKNKSLKWSSIGLLAGWSKTGRN